MYSQLFGLQCNCRGTMCVVKALCIFIVLLVPLQLVYPAAQKTLVALGASEPLRPVRRQPTTFAWTRHQLTSWPSVGTQLGLYGAGQGHLKAALTARSYRAAFTPPLRTRACRHSCADGPILADDETEGCRGCTKQHTNRTIVFLSRLGAAQQRLGRREPYHLPEPSDGHSYVHTDKGLGMREQGEASPLNSQPFSQGHQVTQSFKILVSHSPYGLGPRHYVFLYIRKNP